ncbi:MAG: hypothetical protein JWL81_2810 [Verrucomicrobiales bacterium]|nr:hypothetical protein [Verrucomicrobiales bacterium]
MKPELIHSLYVNELKDLYSAEKQMEQVLPRMARAAASQDLKASFETHLLETRDHVARLEHVFSLAEAEPEGTTSRGMETLINEAASVMEHESNPELRDAALLAVAQKAEHYEIAGYGCVRTYAELLGLTEAARYLQATLNEEKQTDLKLADLAEYLFHDAVAA